MAGGPSCKQQVFFEQAKTLPDALAREVLDFVGYLKQRGERLETHDLIRAQQSSRTISGQTSRMAHGIFNAGQLVTIPFPFAEKEKSKPRPVLLISNPNAYGDFICLAVTSCERESDALAMQQLDVHFSIERRCVEMHGAGSNIATNSASIH